MSPEQTTPSHHPFQTLRQFAQRNKAERCGICNAVIPPGHAHLLDISTRKLVCSCNPCAIVLSGNRGKYRRVPQKIRFLPNFKLTDSQWEDLMIPINMAFFFEDSAAAKVTALYPSPAGVVESLLPRERWNDIVAENAELKEMEPDVEALLVNRLGAARGHDAASYYLLPIDECFRLVGLIRTHWHGLSGGTEVWREVAKFFAGMKERSCLT